MGVLVRVAPRRLIWLNDGRCWHQWAIRASPNSSIGRDGPPPPAGYGGGGMQPVDDPSNGLRQWPRAGSIPICRVIGFPGVSVRFVVRLSCWNWLECAVLVVCLNLPKLGVP